MTTIIAQRCGSETWIGSDSLAAHGSGLKHPLSVEKWKKIGAWRVATCGPARMLTVLDYYAKGSKVAPEFANDHEMADFLHSIIEADKWVPETRELGAPRRWEASFIIVTPDLRVLLLSTTGWLAEFGEKFLAIGSGCEWAEGAAHALRNEPAGIRMQGALDAAYAMDCHTGGVPYAECLSIKKPVGRCVPRFTHAMADDNGPI